MSTHNNKEFSISILLVVGLLAVVGLIYLFVFSVAEDGYGRNMDRAQPDAHAELLKRIRPVMTLDEMLGGAETVVVETTAAAMSPKQLYDGACLACHGTGVAGAPLLGARDAWQPRMAAGIDALLSSARAGKGAMPPNGGSDYSDDEMRAVIEFMLAEAGLMEAAEVMASPDTQTAESDAVVAQAENSALDLEAGEQVYRTACFICHDSGAAGAPKLGDPSAWSARVENGFDAVLQNAINGKGAMPAKGGAAHLSEAEIASVVAFILDKAK